mgnify:CR=1 FL=1
MSGETKHSTIATGVKRTDSTRNEVIPPYLIAAFTGDRSGSMEGIDEASAKGLFNWLKETTQSAVDNAQTGKIFVTTFDDETEKIIEDESISDIHNKIKNNNIDDDFCFQAMKARGTTKLYDTAITDLENIVIARDTLYESLPSRIRSLNPEIAMIWACCTDGFDNKSTHTRKEFREKVLWAREKGVKCFFLAANQEAQVVGRDYGFDPNTSLTFGADVEHVEFAMRSVTQCMRQVSQGNNNYVFSQMMREQSVPSTITPFNSPHNYSPIYNMAQLRQPAVTNSTFSVPNTQYIVTPSTIAQIGRS